MNHGKKDPAVIWLQIVLAVVVFIQAAVFAFHPHAAESFARTGWPDAVRLGLAWSEMAGAVLFVIPATSWIGAWTLLAVFVAAAAVHLAHHEYNIGSLVIDAGVVMVVLAHRERPEKVSPS
jgi:hypothetical protein